jgi:hypothetical protein
MAWSSLQQQLHLQVLMWSRVRMGRQLQLQEQQLSLRMACRVVRVQERPLLRHLAAARRQQQALPVRGL